MGTIRRGITAAWIVVLLAATAAVAQVQTGSITGTVTDASNAVLPGVTMTLTGERLIGGASTQVTDAAGTYRFDRLPPGTYVVKFELQGFKTVDARRRPRSARRSSRRSTRKLEVGSVTEIDHGHRRIADGRHQVEPAADGDEPGDSRRRADRPRSVVAGQADSRRAGRDL